MTDLRRPFGLLVLAQAAHSVEEYTGRLWESFPPAAVLTRAVSADQELAFLLINLLLVGFGIWCWLGPVRRGAAVAVPLAWGWVVLETINGIVHPAWAIRIGGYTPGLVTAPVLLLLALALGRALR